MTEKRIQELVSIQKAYCEANNLPSFLPSSGRCYHCGRNIFDPPLGFTEIEARERYISYCPMCMRSFCE